MNEMEKVREWVSMCNARTPLRSDGGDIYVVSSANIRGPDAGRCADESKLMAKYRAEGNTDALKEVCNVNPAQGCACVLGMAQSAAHFTADACIQDVKDSGPFKAFIANILSCPLFILKLNQNQVYTREDKSWKEAIDSIAGMFSSIEKLDKDQIISSLTDLAANATSHHNTSTSESLFAMSDIYSNNNEANIDLYIYFSNIAFESDKTKGCTSNQSKVDITTIHVEFNTSIWPSVASTITEDFQQSLDDWKANMNTSKGSITRNLCIF